MFAYMHHYWLQLRSVLLARKEEFLREAAVQAEEVATYLAGNRMWKVASNWM